MSFLYIRPYLSVVDNNHCPISFYSRFLIALFILGIGLTASIIIKELPQNNVISTTTNVDEPAAPVKGCLESFPRDFTLNLSLLNYFPTRRNDMSSEFVRYSVEKQPADASDVMMDKTYSGTKASGAGNNDEKPFLSANLNLYEMPEKELLKLGYQRHITRNGDTLSTLAERYYQDSQKWIKIYEFNKDQLTNEKVVPIGIVLIIPLE